MTGKALVVGEVDDGVLRVLGAVDLVATRVTDPDPAAVAAADIVVCGSEDERSMLEQRIPAAVGKTVAAGSPLKHLARLRAGTDPRTPVRDLAVVGTDLKFINPLLDSFRRSGRFEVRVDEWPRFRVHDEAATRETLEWADVVICEWCGPNAVLASRTKRPGQRLVVRLHRMELSHPDWRDVDIDAVDTLVSVGPYYRDEIVRVTGWPDHKVTVIPNAVDDLQLARPKQPGARFHLGMIGVASSRKRLDLALDTLVALRRTDPRYTLLVKGSLPWGLKWVEDRPEERAYFADIRRRLDDRVPGNPSRLGDWVVFDPAGPDVAAWLRNVGFVLSTSDDESFHLAPAEGMASGAVPVIRPWPGAERIYDPEWIVGGAEAMADRILAIGANEATWNTARLRAQRQVVTRYRFDDIVRRWLELLDGP